MKRLRYLFVCLFILFCLSDVVPLRAASGFYYKQLGVEQGLSQSRVQCLLYDYKGYLWIGTQYGLNCYDRDELKNYFHEPANEQSLTSNDIVFIVEDSLKNLWVGTREDGLCLFDRTHSCFKRIMYEGNPLQATSCLLVEGGILFGGIGDIYKYAYSGKSFTKLPLKGEDRTFSYYTHLIRFDEKTILANTRWYGIYSLDIETNEIKKLKGSGENTYTSLFVDSRQRMWVGSYGNGLYCYEDKKLIKHFTTKNSPLSCNIIQDIKEKDDSLWVATDGGGINLISLSDFSFNHMMQIQDDVTSFPSNALYCLYQDPMNNMWVGSIRNGLIGIKQVYAKSYTNVPFNNRYGLSNRTISCFFQDDNGLIWIGTDGGGINCYDPQTETFKHFEKTRYEKVTSIVEFSEQELLVSLFNKGLFYFEKRSGSLRPFIILNEEENKKISLSESPVEIKRTDQNEILISSEDIYTYNIANKSFKRIASKGKDFVRGYPVMKTGEQPSRTLVVDYRNICEYDSQTDSFSIVYEGERVIADMCIDTYGNFWIGCSDGLYYFNRASGVMDRIETTLFDGVSLLVADNKGRIWVGTQSNLLFSYDIDSGIFVLMGESDGVKTNEYRKGLRTAEGDVYIGGGMGMTRIDRDIQFGSVQQQNVELIDVFFNGIPVRKGIDSTSPSLSLPWNFSSIQLKVLVNEDDIFRKNVFRYAIKGTGRQEEFQSFNHSYFINYLPVGDYVVSVSYITKSGEWSNPDEVLHLVITPPWWRTAWFICLCLFLLAAIGFRIAQVIYKRKKEKQLQEIEQLKGKMYEDKIHLLIHINHELRTPLTLICAPLKRILDHSLAVPNLEMMLSEIFKQAKQMKNIIDMVLDVQKLEEGANTLQITMNPLNDWIRTVADQFKNEFASKRVEMIYQLDERIKNIPFDQHKCDFVLSNLLMNALKFSESDTTITLITSFIEERKSVRVEVRDQGIGLGTVEPEKLFSLFYQGKHGKSGSGIGLSYSKTLIELHGGTIGAFDNENAGACFFFELPSDENNFVIPPETSNNEDTIPSTNYPEKNDFSFLKTFSILVVEDVYDLRSYMKTSFTDYFAHVFVAKDGYEALDLIAQHQPDIVVSDVMMPRLDGFELCSAIKENLHISHIPVILLTAYSQASNMSTGYKLGADGFIAKPFEMDVLLALIVNQLKTREVIKSRYRDNAALSLQEITFSNADEVFLEKLNLLIAEHMADQEMDVAFIAKEMGVSRSLLFNKIKALTGLGIIDYVNKLRIDQASYLLLNTSMNLTEISEKVGFSTLRYFSRVFKNQRGMTPSAYKKEGSAGEELKENY